MIKSRIECSIVGQILAPPDVKKFDIDFIVGVWVPTRRVAMFKCSVDYDCLVECQRTLVRVKQGDWVRVEGIPLVPWITATEVMLIEKPHLEPEELWAMHHAVQEYRADPNAMFENNTIQTAS